MRRRTRGWFYAGLTPESTATPGSHLSECVVIPLPPFVAMCMCRACLTMTMSPGLAMATRHLTAIAHVNAATTSRWLEGEHLVEYSLEEAKRTTIKAAPSDKPSERVYELTAA